MKKIIFILILGICLLIENGCTNNDANTIQLGNPKPYHASEIVEEYNNENPPKDFGEELHFFYQFLAKQNYDLDDTITTIYFNSEDKDSTINVVISFLDAPLQNGRSGFQTLTIKFDENGQFQGISGYGEGLSRTYIDSLNKQKVGYTTDTGNVDLKFILQTDDFFSYIKANPKIMVDDLKSQLINDLRSLDE
ncbi:hypothetical protein [Listeria goaensis]|uniref:hypothetical protein n=1 Tax=Listeria goaensis TaxID=1649188 RepID=UPI000B596C74|nr:hypothetical protein [Listeria goaensis]